MSKKPTLADEAFDNGEVAVEVIRAFADLPVGTKADLIDGGSKLYFPGSGTLDLPENITRNLEAYFKKAE